MLQAGSALAAAVRAELPWVKVVASLRKPISQAISLLNHHLQHENSVGGAPCLADSDLFTFSPFRLPQGTLHGCACSA
jgi:hypothetical protein